jgi:hypothetical protein
MLDSEQRFNKRDNCRSRGSLAGCWMTLQVWPTAIKPPALGTEELQRLGPEDGPPVLRTM